MLTKYYNLELYADFSKILWHLMYSVTLIFASCIFHLVSSVDWFQEQGEVLTLFCSLLAQVIALQSHPGSLRERLQPKVQEISNRYGREGYKCSADLVKSFAVLKEFLVFFDYYNTKQYNLALKVKKQNTRLVK